MVTGLEATCRFTNMQLYQVSDAFSLRSMLIHGPDALNAVHGLELHQTDSGQSMHCT